MKLFWKAGAVAGACVACCTAPLAFVPLAAAFGFATAGLAFASEIGTALLLGVVATSIYVWRRRQAARMCNCVPDAGCSTGPSCNVPIAPGSGNIS